MAILTNLSPSSSFGGLLNLLGTSGLSLTLQVVQDGFGNNSPLSLSKTSLDINTTMGGFSIDNVLLISSATQIDNVCSGSSFGEFSTSLDLPSGTTAQRPNAPLAGTIRFNSETGIWEGFKSGQWHQFQTVPIP